VRAEDIEAHPDLELVAVSDEAGVYIAKSTDSRHFFVFGHPEYDRATLGGEYERDINRGIEIAMPRHYYPGDDPSRAPKSNWRAHSQLLYTNWLNYYVYQTTPYDVRLAGKEDQLAKTPSTAPTASDRSPYRETEDDDGPERHIVHREDILDNVQREITEFLGSMMSKRLPRDVAERAQRLLRLTDELESVSDECATVLKVVKRLRKNRQRISDVSTAMVLSVHDRVYAFAEKVSPWVRSPRPVIDVEAVQAESREIHEFIRDCRRTQLGRVGPDDPDSPLRVLGELDIINAYERVRAYYLNIAETLAGGKFAR
jgi:hypothetical protein